MTAPAVVRRRERALQRLRDATSVRVSQHAAARALELGFHEAEVLSCVAAPEQTYVGSSDHRQGRRLYQRGDCTIVLDEANRTVVTVLLRSASPWQHGVHDRIRCPQTGPVPH
jgi:hypothetical protein